MRYWARRRRAREVVRMAWHARGQGFKIPSAPPAISPFHRGSERCCQQTTLASTDAVTARLLAQAITSEFGDAADCGLGLVQTPEARFP
jgi:hypothetical protein